MNYRQFMFLVVFAFLGWAHADSAPLIQKLEQEDATWHKYFVFTTAVSARSAEDRSEAIKWMYDRIQSGKASDSRYAIAYSTMLWHIPPNAIPSSAKEMQRMLTDSLTFAVAGYLALQIESARCEVRNESIQIARQWYDPIRQQIREYKSLPRERKNAILSAAHVYANRLSSVSATATTTGSDWLCYLLPSYQSQIARLPDTTVDARQEGAVVMVFTGHPVIKPKLASEQSLEERKKRIIEEMESL